MLNQQLFELADKIDCADDYIMGYESRNWDDVLSYIENTKCRIDTLIFKPKTNSIRFMFLPSTANNHKTEVFNVKSPPVAFLRRLWEIDVSDLQNAISKFIVQSYKDKYDGLESDDKTWVTAIILGMND